MKRQLIQDNIPIAGLVISHRVLVYLLFCLLFVFTDITANQTVESKQIAKENVNLKVTVSQDQQLWAAFPIVSSSPETGLMLGGMFFHFFPVDDLDKQASSIDLMAYGTTEGQYALSVSPNIFIDDGLYLINAMVQWSFWTANYHNLGNNSSDISEKYESADVEGSLKLQRRLFNKSMTLDFIVKFQDIDIKIEAGGMLDSGHINGHEDGRYIGAGMAVGYDTRDNTNSPRKGSLVRYEYIAFDSDRGSDLDFNIQTWDLRHYHKTSAEKNSVLAIAAQIRDTQGDVPFRQLSSPDGTMILRGIENGRYRDNDMLALQAEYRFPIKGRFSGAAFAEVAQVVKHLSEIDIDAFKTSLGGGIHYALNPGQRLNIRADVAWVDDGMGMIINIRSAF